MVETDQVERVIISPSEIDIIPKEDSERNNGKLLYTGNLDDDNLVGFLIENDVEFTREQYKITI